MSAPPLAEARRRGPAARPRASLVARGIVKRFGDLARARPRRHRDRPGHPRAARRERRRQVDAREDPLRLPARRRGRDPPRRRAGRARAARRSRARLGIGLVFQSFTLIPAFTVAENVALFLPDLGRMLDQRRDRGPDPRDVAAIRPRRSTRPAVSGRCRCPEQQRVEILRVLLAGARILIFDEPTSTLPAQEIDALFGGLPARSGDDGYPIVLITHKLRRGVRARRHRHRDAPRRRRRDAADLGGDRASARRADVRAGAAPAVAAAARAGPRRRPLLELRGATRLGQGPAALRPRPRDRARRDRRGRGRRGQRSAGARRRRDRARPRQERRRASSSAATRRAGTSGGSATRASASSPRARSARR